MAAKNRKKSDAIKEQALLLYATTGNLTRTAETLGIAKSTLFGWVNAPEHCEQVARVRIEKRMEFADKASELIDKGLLLLQRRLDTANQLESELEALLASIAATPNTEIPQQTKTALIAKIKTLEVQRLGDITTAVGTLFDKRALARGETTANAAFEVNIKIVD